MVRAFLFLLFIFASTTQSYAYANNQYDDYINAAAARYGVPPALIKAVIQQESGFNPRAVSSANGRGLMQLTPVAIQDLQDPSRFNPPVTVGDVFDPETNIMAGTAFLKKMLDQNGGDVALALAAYNAGQGNVDRYNGVPPFQETVNYVRNIAQNYQNYGGPAIAGVPPASHGTNTGSPPVFVNATAPGAVISSTTSAQILTAFETYIGVGSGGLNKILVGISIGLLFIFAVLQIVMLFKSSAMGSAGNELTRFSAAGVMTIRTMLFVSILFFFLFNSL